MVVSAVSENIEEKIRRLRELGKSAAEPEPAVPAKPARIGKPPRRPSRIGNLRQRERRKRILIGAMVITIIAIIIVAFVYTYIQNQEVKKLQAAKQAKIAEVNKYFTGNLSKDPVKAQLISQINAAKSVDEVNAIDVKGAYERRIQELKALEEQQKQQQAMKELNALKEQKKAEVETAFAPLLAEPLPSDLRNEVISTLNSLESTIDSATSKEEISTVDTTPYLNDLWRKYYYHLIDSIPTDKVVLKKGSEKHIYTKVEAKYEISKVENYTELLEYEVAKAEMVRLALVLTRESVVNGYLEPGARIQLFAKNGSNVYVRIVDEGFVNAVLLPTQAGSISVSESQSDSSSYTNQASTSYSETSSSQETYQPGSQSLSTSESTSLTDQQTTGQTSTESSSASYTYSTNLAEILKALAAGKIVAGDEVQRTLDQYGWKLLDLEQATKMMVLDPNTPVLVIVEVPSELVPDILTYKNQLYVAEIVG